ncbi:uncharacterized protein [Montipora capricornis]|uniref:uncharacterized protein n=1 Tax=Montipora capricornis TaxID=246305 RepID=UPI0035F10E87
MDFARVQTRPIQATLKKYNIEIKENDGLNEKTGFWWLRFTFDYKLEKAIEIRLTNFKYSPPSAWTLEVVKCQYLSITCADEMVSFDMEDDLVNSQELRRLNDVTAHSEKLLEYLEINIVPLVIKKIKYTRFTPQFCFFLSHKSKDKPLMRTFVNGLKFLGYKTWLDEDNMPMAAQLQGALKVSIEESDCLIAWLNKEYLESEYCKAELLYARDLGKIILPFGVYEEIEGFFTGEFEFLRKFHIYDTATKSFFEVLRRIDESLFNFESLAI